MDLEINLTPLIDVVFLLLIFFMVTTTFSKEAEIRLQLPETVSADKPDSDERFLVIQITKSGVFAIKGAEDQEPRELINASHRTLQRSIRLAATGMSDPVVLIRADRQTPHEAVIKAMDAARHQELYQIIFATDNTR